MKITNSWVAILFGLVLTGSPTRAQEFQYIPHIDEAKTPVELQLRSDELSLPGLGIGSMRVAIVKRLDYALAHNWLSPSQNQLLCSELKVITDKENSQRDASGKLNYEARLDISRQLTEINDQFEEMVLVREQSNPGIQGIKAKQAMMIQRINQALSSGKMTTQQAAQMKAAIRVAAAELPQKDISEELSRKIASNLNKINNELDKNLYGSSMATRPLPVSR